MTLWIAIGLASLACFLLKWLGYQVPEAWVSGPVTSRVTALLPVALLSGLVVVQTCAGDQGSVVFDARVVALAVAVVLLLLRANFLVVVVGAAVVAAGLRAAGWG